MAASDYEILDDRFGGCIKGSARVEKLFEGCRWAEGPAWFPMMRSVIWSDIPNDRMLRWDETTGATGVFRHPAGYSNGNTVDREGRLVSCEHGNRRVTRTEHDGSITVIADQHDGKRLNSPNDVVVKSDGSIWFTDPPYGIDSDYEGHKAEVEQAGNHVYRVDPGTGEVRIVVDDFDRPNGLAFTPDESQLVISDTGSAQTRHFRIFDVSGDTLSGGDVFRDVYDRRIRRVQVRHGRADLDQRGRWGALHRYRWHADRESPDSRGRRQCRVRWPEAEPALHLRHDLTLLSDAARSGCEDILEGGGVLLAGLATIDAMEYVTMSEALLVVDVQNGFVNEFTRHIPARIAALIERGEHGPVLFTRFVNIEGSPFRRFLDWHQCERPPETEFAPEIAGYAVERRVYSKPGYVGISDELGEYLQDQRIGRVAVVGIDTDMCVLKVAMDLFDLNIEPIVLVDCCASTAGLQTHLAGLAVLARNIGAERLRDAGLSGGHLAAPPPS